MSSIFNKIGPTFTGPCDILFIEMEEMANFITEELDARGWSMREAARRAGVSHSLISKVVSGSTPASADFCVAMAHVFDADPIQVMQKAGILKNPPPPTPLDDQLLDAFHRLKERDQQAAATLLFDLAETRVASTFPESRPDQTVTWGEVDAHLQPYMLEIAEVFLTLMGTPVFGRLTDLALAFRDRQRREQEQIHHQEPSPEPNCSTS